MSSASGSLPLDGKRILVTRARDKAKPLVDKLTALGALVQVVPVLSIEPASDWNETDRAIARIEEFDWIVFASANAVQYFLGRCRKLGALDRLKCKIAAIGPATAKSLSEFELTAHFVPSTFIAESFVNEMTQVAALHGTEILWPRGNRGRMLIAEALETAGAHVQTVACYESSVPAQRHETATELGRLLKLNLLDIVVFASGESVKNFADLALEGLEAGHERSESNDNLPRCISRVVVASIGSETSKACRRYLGKVDLEASEQTTDGVVSVLIQNACHQR